MDEKTPSRGLRLAKILFRRLNIYWMNDSTAYYNEFVRPVLSAMAKEGYSAAEAIETTGRYALFRGELMLATDAAAENLLIRAASQRALTAEVGVKLVAALGTTMNVISWVFMIAQPAGAEGMNDQDNQLAYRHYIEKHLTLMVRASQYGQESHYVEPPMSQQKWLRSVGL